MVVERCQPFRIIHYTTIITSRYWVCNSLTRVFSNTPPDRLSSGKIIKDRIDPAGRISLALYIIYETSRQIGLAHQKTPRWEVFVQFDGSFFFAKEIFVFHPVEKCFISSLGWKEFGYIPKIRTLLSLCNFTKRRNSTQHPPRLLLC